MKLYLQILKLLFRKFILRKNNGIVIKKFAEKMGIVYIKLAQILATQNYGNLFTEKDREMLSSICDYCNPIGYEKIEDILKQEYGANLDNIFTFIDRNPVGSASVSQVHRAILKNGEEVAIKIKRKDIAKTMNKDMAKIRKLVHRFGKIVHFKNFTGGDVALDLYLKWIEQETDFQHEKENIKLYQKFVDNVNGKVNDTTQIKVPKLYEEYCTSNVIVMEFIRTQTVNKMELNDENKEKIVTALNSYIKLSFWALFHKQQIVFHGDPHSGNICIDEFGNLCFLDMGLLFALNDSDAEFCRTFFLAAHSGNYKKLYNMLLPYGNMDNMKLKEFELELKKYCEEIKEKEVTCYFVDMIYMCLNYEFVPPDFLFGMAKAFVCLNGINQFSDNKFTAKELLQEQTMEFLLNRSLDDCRDFVVDSLRTVPKLLENTLQYGLVNTIAKATTNNLLSKDLKKSLENFKEMLDLVK